MPAIRHCASWQGHKLRIAKMRLNSWTYAETRAEAHGLYMAARNLGYRVSIATLEPGVIRVTLLKAVGQPER